MYCAPCQFEKNAVALAEDIKNQFGEKLSEVILEPTQTIGNFDVSIDGELVFSKNRAGRFPQPGEIEQLLMTRIYK